MSLSSCEAWCVLAGTQVICELETPHEYEHEATEHIEVMDPAGSGTLTTFLVWWGDDGHAFVGSKDAVSTGTIS